ncbi:MAG: class I SAM-dependent methyltransferase [Pseudomonadota bacterium]|nr:class I SAM-dependent methyltransferase [Pseudomonadota bacterium]
MSNPANSTKPNYGVDAPAVIRNMFLSSITALVLSFFVPPILRLGDNIINLQNSLRWFGGWFLFFALFMLLYVKVGKFFHRDFMLSLHQWQGDETVLDVGCGRGLLLAAAAKRLTTGHATGIDIWSNVDMGANSEAATLRNLELEGVASRCTILGEPAQSMSFPDASFDVILSNLCLHNIYDRPTRLRALHQIVRVLKPGGVALISDYKHTGEYATEFLDCGLAVERRWANLKSLVTTYPPLRIVVARKPL